MFKKDTVLDKSPVKTDITETIIGSSVHVEGNLQSKGKVIIRGVVNGSIKTDHDVLIDKEGKVLADIDAKNAIVFGEVKGNLTIKERLEVKHTGIIRGNLHTQKLIIEEGGSIEGHCKTGKIEQEAPLQKNVKLAQNSTK